MIKFNRLFIFKYKNFANLLSPKYSFSNKVDVNQIPKLDEFLKSKIIIT